jgi:hypothetical protein
MIRYRRLGREQTSRKITELLSRRAQSEHDINELGCTGKLTFGCASEKEGELRGVTMGEEVAELHLYIAWALQRLAQRKEAPVKKEDEDKERRPRIRRRRGEGKAKEPFGDDLEYEEEVASEDESEVEAEEDEHEGSELIFAALDKFEEEWRSQACRFERRLSELRASCVSWKVQQDLRVERLKSSLRCDEGAGHPRPTPSAVDLLVETLLQLQAENRRTTEPKRTKESSTPELGSSSSFSRSDETEELAAKLSTLPKGTSATKRRKAVSFTTTAAAEQQQQEQQSPTKAREQERDRVSAAPKEENERKGASPKKQRRRIQSAEDLPKSDRKKKKKGVSCVCRVCVVCVVW